MKTSKKQLATLKQAHVDAEKAYTQYLKEFRAERGMTGRTVIKEIIEFHQSGESRKDIIARGYNKHTVNEQIRLYVKGTKKVATVVAKYIPVEETATVEIDDEEEEGDE